MLIFASAVLLRQASVDPGEGVDQPRGVRQQVADGHLPLGVHQLVRRPVLAGDEHLLALELRQVLRHRVVEPELAVVHQDHGGDAGHRLGHRRQPEDRVRRHRLFRLGVGEPGGAEGGDLPLAGDQHDAAGDPSLLDRRLEQFVDPGELLGGQPDRLGVGPGQVVGPRAPARRAGAKSTSRNHRTLVTRGMSFPPGVGTRTVWPVDGRCARSGEMNRAAGSAAGAGLRFFGWAVQGLCAFFLGPAGCDTTTSRL